MDRIFNMDNKFFTFMGRVADLIILNLIFLLCCVPIVTIGASVTSMYYVTLKMARNEESYIIKSFFKAFKQNFKQSTCIWLIMLVVLAVLILDFQITGQLSGTFNTILRYSLVFLAFLYSLILLYVFPVLAKFYNTTKNTLKNALLMAIRHLPSTLVMLVLTIVPLAVTVLVPILMAYGLLAWILIGFSLIAFLNSKFLVKIFDRYLPKEEPETECAENPGVFSNLTITAAAEEKGQGQ